MLQDNEESFLKNKNLHNVHAMLPYNNMHALAMALEELLIGGRSDREGAIQH